MRFSQRMKWGKRFHRLGLKWLACLIGWHQVKRSFDSMWHCVHCREKWSSR